MGLEVNIYDTPAGGICASQGTFSSYISDKFKAYHFMTLLKYPAHFFLRSECSLCVFDDTVIFFYHLCNCDTFMF